MLGLLRRSLVVLPVVMGLGACGSEDEFTSNVAGDYTIKLTNGKSTCNFQNWMEGNTADVDFVITQDGKSLTGKINNQLLEAFFNAFFGPDDFKGSISGDTFTLTKPGSPKAQGNCAYSYNATIDGTQSGDSISGTITYETIVNNNPDCAAVECSATQRFSGSRPPQ